MLAIPAIDAVPATARGGRGRLRLRSGCSRRERPAVGDDEDGRRGQKERERPGRHRHGRAGPQLAARGGNEGTGDGRAGVGDRQPRGAEAAPG